MLCCCTVQYFTMLYCTVFCCVVLCCCFATIPLSGTVVQFLQFWTLHFTSQYFNLCFCFFRFDNLSSISFFFASSRGFEVFLLWNYLCQSHLVALQLLCFDLVGPQVVRWLLRAMTMVPWRWGPGHKPVAAGTLSWWSEKYRFEGKHSHPFCSYILYMIKCTN